MTNTATYIPKGPKLALELGILMGCNFLGGFNESMMNIALVHVSESFGVTLSVANFAVLGFTIMAATAITVSAAALARFGLRRVSFFALATCVLGCAIGWFAVDFPLVVVARVLQAFSVGVFFPTVTSVIMSIVGMAHRGVVLSVNSAIIGVGVMLGPSVSGIMLDALGLRGVFLAPGALAAVLLVLAAACLKDVYARTDRPVDALSVALSLVGLACVIFGLSELLSRGAVAVVALVCGLAVMGAFVWRQIKLAAPLLDLSPFKNKVFALGVATTLCIMMSESSTALILPLYFEGACGYGSGGAGLLLVAPLATYAAMDVVAGRLYDAHGVWPIVPCGAALICAGVAALFVFADGAHVLPMVLCAVVLYCGVGLGYPPTKTTELAALDAGLVSNGSAINSCTIQVANSLGQAIFVGVMSADVARSMAAGAAKQAAYATAFTHTLVISAAVAVGALVIGTIFANRARKGAPGLSK